MVPTPAGTPGQTEEYRKAASYPQGIVSECGQVLRRLATDLVVVVCRPCWRLPGEHSHSAAGHSSLESQSLEQMEIEQRKGRRRCGGHKQTPPSADGCAG